jgi:nitroreductase
METYDVMRTTFAAREYADESISDETLYLILDNARFAPSGGNRQGWKVIIVRDRDVRERIADFAKPVAQRYLAQSIAGESPFNTIHPSWVDDETIRSTVVPPVFFEPILRAPVLLVICVDLAVVASVDSHLDRVGIASGASIYPFAWNILLAARNEGYGGVLTTFATASEAEMQSLLGLPESIAVAAVLPIGKPVKQLTELARKPVEEFAVWDTWSGEPLRRP